MNQPVIQRDPVAEAIILQARVRAALARSAAREAHRLGR